MVLYRADEAGNKTAPERFHSDGLLSKQVNSGDDPRPHIKYGWLNTIKSHINPKGDLQLFIHHTSAYLSTTSKFAIAQHYLRTRSNYDFLPVSRREDAGAFLFEFCFDASGLEEVGTGLFIYSFTCNYRRGEKDPKFASLIGHITNCNICRHQEHYRHKMLLIDASRFLNPLKNLYQQDYENAVRDHEWLLLPMDPMLDGPGFQSRIPISDFWRVYFFRYVL